MKTKSIFGIAAIFACGLSAPAMAAWDSIGTVEVGRGQDRDSAYTQFAGGIDRLQFVAQNGDVNCRFIRALYVNGRTDTIFQGTLRRGDTRTIDLPGQSQHIRRLDFACSGDRARQTVINIMVDVSTPSYRDEWRHSPAWSRWSAIFNWGPAQAPITGPSWTRVGVQTFGYNNTRDASFAGFAGRSVRQIGLRSDADAQCPRVWATFANGQKVNLANGTESLRAGQMANFDLPGNYRNLTAVSLTCRAVRNRDVAIQVYAR